MENVEQLKIENDKLKERLNNAAKFFREQKAQIEALTKENEELKRIPQESNSEEIESLKEQLATSNAACADMEKTIHNNLEHIEQITKENDKLKNEYLNNKNELGETLAVNKELMSKIKELEEKYETTVKGYEEHRLSEEAYEDDLNKQLNQYELKLQDQENINNELNAKINDLNNEIKEHKQQYTKLSKEYDELNKTYNEATIIYNNNIAESKKEITIEKNKYNQLINKISEFTTELGITPHVATNNSTKNEMQRMGSHLESKSEVFKL